MKTIDCIISYFTICAILSVHSINTYAQVRENPYQQTRADGMHWILINTYDARLLDDEKPHKHRTLYALDSVTIILGSNKVTDTLFTQEGNECATMKDFKSGKLQISAFRAGYDTLSCFWKMTHTCQQLELFLKKQEE